MPVNREERRPPPGIRDLKPCRVAPRPASTAADQGADVLLLHPYDDVISSRTRDESGLTVVAPSQLALDCLTGNGRMPAEGEALLEWMGEHEDDWRARDLDEAATRA